MRRQRPVWSTAHTKWVGHLWSCRRLTTQAPRLLAAAAISLQRLEAPSPEKIRTTRLPGTPGLCPLLPFLVALCFTPDALSDRTVIPDVLLPRRASLGVVFCTRIPLPRSRAGGGFFSRAVLFAVAGFLPAILVGGGTVSFALSKPVRAPFPPLPFLALGAKATSHVADSVLLLLLRSQAFPRLFVDEAGRGLTRVVLGSAATSRLGTQGAFRASSSRSAPVR